MSTRGSRIRPLLAVLAALGAGLAAGVALRRLDAVEVEGLSMAPALLPGDLLLAESWTYARRPPRPGEVVLAPDPRNDGRELIKRVALVRAGGLELRGDRPAFSTDSRQFGTVPASKVRWHVILRYWPPSSVGRLPPPAAPVQLEPEGGEPACTAFEHLVVGGEASL